MATAPEVREHVMQVVAEYLGRDMPITDETGDVPVRWGSALYWVTIIDHDPPLVRVWSDVLTEVEEDTDLYKRLNELNAQVKTARIYWRGGRVVAVTELPAHTLDTDELSHACRSVGTLADWADTALQPRFGGVRAFKDEQAGS